MPGRSLKGHVAHISTGFLRLVNWVVVSGALASIVIMFVIKHSPSFPAGWGFVALGVVTTVAGLFGAISSGQGGCFGCHLLGMLLSTAGLCVSFLVIFFKLDTVLNEIGHDTKKSTAKSLLRAEGALYFILFCSQLVTFLLSCLIYQCGLIDFYEDLEAQTVEVNPKQAAKEQAAAERRKEKMEAKSAHVLADKMKKKYGAYNEDPAYSRDEA